MVVGDSTGAWEHLSVLGNFWDVPGVSRAYQKVLGGSRGVQEYFQMCFGVLCTFRGFQRCSRGFLEVSGMFHECFSGFQASGVHPKRSRATP